MGDENALAQLLATHRDRLWRIVHFRMDWRLIGRVDADDILQNSFVEAAKRIHHFAEQKQYSAFVWLRMIVGQTLIDMHRRHLGTQQRDASRELNSFASSTSASMTDFLAGHLTTPSEAAMRDEQKVQLLALEHANWLVQRYPNAPRYGLARMHVLHRLGHKYNKHFRSDRSAGGDQQVQMAIEYLNLADQQATLLLDQWPNINDHLLWSVVVKASLTDALLREVRSDAAAEVLSLIHI